MADVRLRRAQAIRAQLRKARRRATSPPRFRDDHHRVAGRGGARRFRRQPRRHRPGRRPVDDRGARYHPRGVPLHGLPTNRRHVRDGAAVAEPTEEGQDEKTAVSTHPRETDPSRPAEMRRRCRRGETQRREHHPGHRRRRRDVRMQGSRGDALPRGAPRHSHRQLENTVRRAHPGGTQHDRIREERGDHGGREG